MSKIKLPDNLTSDEKNVVGHEKTARSKNKRMREDHHVADETLPDRIRLHRNTEKYALKSEEAAKKSHKKPRK
jgi:hypothetical protein